MRPKTDFSRRGHAEAEGRCLRSVLWRLRPTDPRTVCQQKHRLLTQAESDASALVFISVAYDLPKPKTSRSSIPQSFDSSWFGLCTADVETGFR